MSELEKKKKELEDLQNLHKSMWDDYGSELSAGDMIRQEEELKNQILKLENNGRKKRGKNI